MIICQLITHQKNIPKYIWDNNIHTIQYGRKILWQFFILMDPESFPYMLWSPRHPIWVMWTINEHTSTNIKPEINRKCYMGQLYPYSKVWEKILWLFFIFIELEPFCYYLVITKIPNLSNVKWKLAQSEQY